MVKMLDCNSNVLCTRGFESHAAPGILETQACMNFVKLGSFCNRISQTDKSTPQVAERSRRWSVHRTFVVYF